MSSFRLGRREQSSGFHDINVTPMVDVMLVMLAVFMVTAPLLATGLPVDLPAVQAGNTPVRHAGLVLSITSDERIFLGERDVTANVESVLRSDPVAQREHELYLRSDKLAHYGVVARAVAAAQSAGIRSLSLLVEPATEEPPR